MAGHSRWAKVKHYKGTIDQRRGKLFSKLSKEITVAAKLGGGDPNFNPRLRQAIATARGESMPVDNIERGIKKGTGELEGAAYEEMVYEGYGPGGVAILLEAATDNKNRAAAEIRAIFTKNHGHLGGSGSVAWMFHHKGVVTITAPGISEDDVILTALDAGAEDVRSHEDIIEIVTPPDNTLHDVTKALELAKIPIASAKLSYVPGNPHPSPTRTSPSRSSRSSRRSTITTTSRPSTPTSTWRPTSSPRRGRCLPSGGPDNLLSGSSRTALRDDRKLPSSFPNSI